MTKQASSGSDDKGAALVTGATGGIGYELAALLAADGYPLILVARGKADLDRVAAEFHEKHGVVVETLASDLSEPTSINALMETLDRRSGPIDILVNNAGFASYGPFVENDPARELAMIQVNVTALTALTRHLLPAMVARGMGRVLNVASTAAFQPGPLMAVYYATKAYVLSFSQAIADELRDTGVTVTALCPGPTATGFQDRAEMQGSRLFRFGVMDAPAVAAAGYAGMQAGKTIVIPGRRNRLFAESVRLAPRTLLPKVVRRMQQR